MSGSARYIVREAGTNERLAIPEYEVVDTREDDALCWTLFEDDAERIAAALNAQPTHSGGCPLCGAVGDGSDGETQDD